MTATSFSLPNPRFTFTEIHFPTFVAISVRDTETRRCLVEATIDKRSPDWLDLVETARACAERRWKAETVGEIYARSWK